MAEPTVLRAGRSTLKEIAREAGVSVSTVSLVLAGKAAQRRISHAVQRRVQDVAQQHDYSPNLLVRSLQEGRTRILSFYNAFGHRHRDDLYMDRLSTAIERAAGDRGYDVLVHCDTTRSMDETYERLNGGRSDGLIFFGPAHAHPLLRLLRGSRLSTVLLNHVDEEGVLSSVSEDMEDGMHRVAETLLGLGHRRIAAIGGGPWSDALPRIAALRASLSSRAVLPDRHVLAVYDDGPLRPEEALARLMDDTEPPTALFCWHDRVGYRMLEACERLGIQVPDQLSLIGYDGLHWPSTSQHVLASVEVALDTLAEAAVRLLDELIQGRQDPPERRVYPVSLSRGTTLAPREYP